MGAINAAPAPSASLHGEKFAGFLAVSAPLARNLSPKEFSAALMARGVRTCERTVRFWCESGAIPAAFRQTPGRWLIPATELARFGAEVPA